MSGAGGGSSKRLHEEGGQGHFSPATKYLPHDDASTGATAAPNTVYPNLSMSKSLPNSNEYHAGAAPFELSSDSPPVAKIPRTDSRDFDKRSSPLIPMYRVPSSSSSELHPDHPSASESRVEVRDSLKDGSKDLRVSETNRDVQAESREFHIEVKRDSANKGEKDVGRFESSRTRDNSNREAKYEREVHTSDLKGNPNAVSGHLNWKDAKEYNRGKRYPESNPNSGATEPWHISHSTLHNPLEVGKEVATSEEREHMETHGREAFGENKVGPKGEDKFKDKDRKRKDTKHRDWGEREKERSDRRGNLLIGTSGSECRDLIREERETERWEREREDLFKEKERAKERDKDHIHVKREAWNGVETDTLKHHEKEVADDSIRKAEQQENLGIEQKKLDFDSWKNADRETRDWRKEMDANAEGDRHERRSKIYEKELDDGCTDVDGGGTEREREVLNYGAQHRKRMLRPRGSPQVANCFGSCDQDAEGSQGKPEISTVLYKVGECLQELIKLWREHRSSQSEKCGGSSQSGPNLEIRIPAEHVTATNRQVRGGQLWGTDIYTDDSDLVAVLMHTGYCRPTASPPPSAIHELRATIQVLPPQDCYVSTLRNNVRSRAWGAAIGCSYRVERCCILKKGGGTIELEPCLTHTSAVEPTLAPVAVERTMTTRAAASNALRQQRFVREVTIQYNLCNEPWIKYSISIVADKGLKKPLYTSARLKKGDVLYLETHSRRYELCCTGEKVVKVATAPQMHEVETEKSRNHNLHSSNGERSLVDGDSLVIDLFRWSRCKKPLPQKVMRSVGIPLPLEYLEVLEEHLDWEDVQWSQTGVWIGGKEYVLARVHFLSPN